MLWHTLWQRARETFVIYGKVFREHTTTTLSQRPPPPKCTFYVRISLSYSRIILYYVQVFAKHVVLCRCHTANIYLLRIQSVNTYYIVYLHMYLVVLYRHARNLWPLLPTKQMTPLYNLCKEQLHSLYTHDDVLENETHRTQTQLSLTFIPNGAAVWGQVIFILYCVLDCTHFRHMLAGSSDFNELRKH